MSTKPAHPMIKKCLLNIFLIFLLSGCITCEKDNCLEPPEPFKFMIIDRISREDLVFSENPRYDLDSLRLYYYEEGVAKELVLKPFGNERLSNYLMNQPLPFVSAVNAVKDFYLQLNYRDTDTLLVDVKEIDFNCCRAFQYAGSYINGQKLQRSTEDFTVYLIEK